jgi:hypothetical protein
VSLKRRHTVKQLYGHGEGIEPFHEKRHIMVTQQG